VCERADSVSWFQQSCSTSKIDLQIDTDDIVLHVTQAIPLGLIVNELLTNVLKPAFPEGRAGTVWAGLRYLPDAWASERTLDEGSAVLTSRTTVPDCQKL
jgi:two-component sensor histidine kinase